MHNFILFIHFDVLLLFFWGGRKSDDHNQIMDDQSSALNLNENCIRCTDDNGNLVDHFDTYYVDSPETELCICMNKT